MLRFIAQEVGAEPEDLSGYAERDQTRREHVVEVMREYDFTPFTVKHYRTLSPWLPEQARGTDNGLALACRARARREAYAALSTDLTPEQPGLIP